MRTRVVIQSRLSSSRLPGKALMIVAGMPLIELVARRASRTGFEVVVATSVEAYDDRIAATLEPAGVRVVRGSLDDVLARFLDATSDMDDSDRVVRLTGDNPVGDADLLQELMDEMEVQGKEYGRVDIEVVPEGLGVEVFPVGLLRRAGREATDPYDREHVTPWIRRHTDELLFAPRRNPGQPAVYRATVDCLHDFTRVSRLFDGYADPITVPWADLMDGLVGQVRALGPIAREVPKVSRRLTTLMLGVQNLGRDGSEQDDSVVREVFTRAVEAGVSDVLCAAEDAHVVATGLLPMLKQRMGVSVVLPSVLDATSPDIQVRYLIERARTESGHAHLRCVYLQEGDLESPHGPQLIEVLREYQQRKVVSELGIMLAPGGELAPERADGIDVVAKRYEGEASFDRLRPWDAAGKATVALMSNGSTKAVRTALTAGGVDAVVVQPRNRKELTSLLIVG